jgi:hypothetical protein
VASKQALLYGNECWTLGKVDERQVDAVHTRFSVPLADVTRRDCI